MLKSMKTTFITSNLCSTGYTFTKKFIQTVGKNQIKSVKYCFLLQNVKNEKIFFYLKQRSCTAPVLRFFLQMKYDAYADKNTFFMFINADLKRIGRDLYHVTEKYWYRKVNFGGVLNTIYDGCLKKILDNHSFLCQFKWVHVFTYWIPKCLS